MFLQFAVKLVSFSISLKQQTMQGVWRQGYAKNSEGRWGKSTRFIILCLQWCI